VLSPLFALGVLVALCSVVGAVDYAVVDTGQTTCYDDADEMSCPAPGQPFYGQDAQYAGSQPGYVDNGNGTVADLKTGLMWQQSPDTDGDTDIDADDIDPSGYQGSDTSGLVPFIDTGFFDFAYGDTGAGERIIDAQYWSSTQYVGTIFGGEAGVFGVNFADGRIKGYPRDTGPGGLPMTEFVRCVRGNTDYGVNDLVDNGDGTVTDLATGLMWMRNDSGTGYTWQDALDHAEGLTFAGHDDWRLPSAKELQSIVDYTRSPSTSATAAIDPAYFDTTAITDEGGEANYPFYWTGTTHANWTETSGQWAAYVAFGEALGWMQQPPTPPTPPPGTYVLQDVHGAGAQRSDPKTGDPGDYPHGNGPQGDVVRIYNYVRAVRDAAGGSAVGGIAGIPDEDAALSEVSARSGDDRGLLLLISGSTVALVVLAGGAWYVRRRFAR
jgi:hypothetical protein